MAVQDTIDAADRVVAILNAAVLPESITWAFSFIPEFDPKDMSNLEEPAKGLVFPSQVDISVASRTHDNEDNIVEVGLGRILDNEDADPRQNAETIDAVKDELRKASNQEITLPGDGNVLHFRGAEIVLLVPELLRKRVALSVCRITYRGIV